MRLFFNFFSKNWHYEMFAAEKAWLNKLQKFHCIAGKHGFTVTLSHYAFLGALAKFR